MLDMHVDGFYRAFENRFRGSRETIKSRLQVYRPIIEPLKQFDSRPSALDLGCGRGEWLEVLDEAGFNALGLDLDEGMLEAARARNLNVELANAVDFLRNAGAETQFIISGFHIAEHLEFRDLKILIEESIRVLCPGGLLILETPNSENLQVGTSSFYLDPTHQRPLPSDLLAFLPIYFGFARCKVIRLQESPEIVDAHNVTLLDVLTEVSPDYAIIAQKKGEDKIMLATQQALETDRGISLKDLARKFDTGQMSTIKLLQESVSSAHRLIESGSKRRDDQLASIIGELERTQAEVTRLISQIAEDSASHRQQIDRLQHEYEASHFAMQEHLTRFSNNYERLLCETREQLESWRQVSESYRNSLSWKITAPLRLARSFFRRRP